MRSSPRGSRFRPLVLLALLVLTIIYLMTGSRSTQTSEFYTRTVAAMDARQKSLREGMSGASTAAEHKAAKAQQAAEAKVRNHDGEIKFPEVKDHEGGKGEQVSGKVKEAAANAKDAAQKPIADAKAAAKDAKAKAKAVADEVTGKAKSGAAAAAGAAAEIGSAASKKTEEIVGKAKDYSGKGGLKEDGTVRKEGAKQYSGKGGHKEDASAKPGAAKYKGAGIGDDEIEEEDSTSPDSVHGPTKDASSSSASAKGKKVQGKAGDDDGVAKVGNTGKGVKQDAKKAVKSAAGAAANAVKAAVEAPNKTDRETEALLDGILKRSPLIIFSKSYCPFSKKAKHILLEEYKIVPAPYVEELDEHPQGEHLQDALLRTTSRRTVPNILVNGVSIGGGDDIAALHAEGKLAQKILDLGGKRFVEVSKVSAGKSAGDKADAKVAAKALRV